MHWTPIDLATEGTTLVFDPCTASVYSEPPVHLPPCTNSTHGLLWNCQKFKSCFSSKITNQRKTCMQNIRCPKCGSADVQTFKLIWQQSFRENEKGRKAISKHGWTHRPPPRIRLGFLLTFFVLAPSLLVTGLAYLNNTSRTFPELPVLVDESLFIFWLIIVIGLSVGMWLGARLMKSKYSVLLEVWENSYSCRVCGNRFQV